MPVQELLQHEVLRHMPPRVVYLSAAAVEDCGIRVGREGSSAGPPVRTSSEPSVRKRWKLRSLRAYLLLFVALCRFRTLICRLQQTNKHASNARAYILASAVERLVMLPESRGYISPAGRAAALQRDRQDCKQLTSLLPWHASARTGEGRRRRCACVWKGAL